MSPVLIVFAAVKALGRNRLRSLLTMLGIMIGIAAVICTVALGQGSAAQIHQDLLMLGDNFVWVENGSRNVAGVRSGAGGVPRLTDEDMTAIVAEVPEIVRCSPQVDARSQVVAAGQNWNTTYRGVSSDYLLIRKWSIAAGSGFSDLDIERRAKVALLGQTVVDQLFPAGRDPVGQGIRIGTQMFTVQGVLNSKGPSSTGQDQDDFILVPYTTAQRHLKGTQWLDDVLCTASSEATIPAAREHMTDLLRIRHRIAPGQNDDFNLPAPDEAIKTREEAARTMGLMLSLIAAVSLLVGGVGVMNIMLVSVSERTREIGLRMAVGARARDVRRQFLAEAVVLSVVGGTIGIAAGVFASRAFADAFGWPALVSVDTIAIATAFSTGTGLVFGYYPARRASTLDPIDALRFE
jgi:putative ABC transport system permease protein